MANSLAPAASSPDDQEVLDNIGARMHGPEGGFIKKFFGDFQYAHEDGLFKIQTAEGVSSEHAIPSAPPLPDDFLEWFSNYVARESDGARGSWHISSGDAASEYGIRDDGAHVLLTMPTSPSSDTHIRWNDVQVVGQFYRSCSVCYREGLLRLCRSAYQVFASQPLRLFLHGFYIRGSLIELWVFDRSGIYCSNMFDVRKDFCQFLSVILSYQRMTDQDLGKSNIIMTDESGSYIILNSVAAPSLRRLYLESKPIASREGLAGTGTTCYRARLPDLARWGYAVKFKWRWARERPEDELLKLAKKKCVWGAVSLDYYEEFESTANLRRSLRWGTHKKFTEPRLRERQGSDEEQQRRDQTAGFVQFTEDTENYFQNRILACTITSPVGRPLQTFQSPLELLQVFRDAIKCHRSLYYDAGILHQDISPGNMIILDNQEERKPKGILIDLDSAIELDERTETELGITGTRPFMAIGVLRNERHTYRHDLESFLYVLLWTIITNRTDNPPETSKLRQWSNGDWSQLAARKSLDVEPGGFENILEEFSREYYPFKPLARSLRQVLFPLREGALWTGTDDSSESREKLYGEITHAFEEAIASERHARI
ncbi:FunK1 protein kinase [Xylaria sp. FL0933]|nr:FunK1 protein kinase [Xylaria sp. FL0933]